MSAKIQKSKYLIHLGPNFIWISTDFYFHIESLFKCSFQSYLHAFFAGFYQIFEGFYKVQHHHHHHITNSENNLAFYLLASPFNHKNFSLLKLHSPKIQPQHDNTLTQSHTIMNLRITFIIFVKVNSFLACRITQFRFKKLPLTLVVVDRFLQIYCNILDISYVLVQCAHIQIWCSEIRISNKN